MFVYRILKYKAYHAHIKIQMEPSWIYIPHVTHHVQYVSIGTCYVLLLLKDKLSIIIITFCLSFLKSEKIRKRVFVDNSVCINLR